MLNSTGGLKGLVGAPQSANLANRLLLKENRMQAPSMNTSGYLMNTSQMEDHFTS
jgi:hypothetical protein